MVTDTSTLLAALLHSQDSREREGAWEQLVAEHSRLILHTIRRHDGTHDEVMDRYAFVLEQLRANDFRRLSSWTGRGSCRFTTWLVVVVTRLCTDYLRRRLGRQRPASEGALAERERRRRLVEFIAEAIDPELAPAAAESESEPYGAEGRLRVAELRAALACTVHQLPAADQLLLALRFRDDLSAAQIARTLSFPTPFHVYRRLNHLLETLRGALRQQGVEDPVP